MELSGNMGATIQLTGSIIEAADLGGGLAGTPLFQFIKDLIQGTGAGKAQLAWYDEGQIAGAADLDIDLSALPGVNGKTLTFTKVKAIFVANVSDVVTDDHDPATDASIQVGGGDGGDGTEAFDTWVTSTADDGSEALILPVGAGKGIFNPTAAGYACSAGNDILRILNVHATSEAAYKIMLVAEGTEA